MSEAKQPNPSGTPGFVLYQSPDGRSRLSVRLEGQTVWLTQAQMGELFQTTKQNVSLHVQSVLEEGELPENRVVKEYLTTAADGTSRSTVRCRVASSGKSWIIAPPPSV